MYPCLIFCVDDALQDKQMLLVPLNKRVSTWLQRFCESHTQCSLLLFFVQVQCCWLVYTALFLCLYNSGIQPQEWSSVGIQRHVQALKCLILELWVEFVSASEKDNLYIKDKGPAPNLSAIRKFYCNEITVIIIIIIGTTVISLLVYTVMRLL